MVIKNTLVSKYDILCKHVDINDVFKTDRNVLHFIRFPIRSLISELAEVILSTNGRTYMDIVVLEKKVKFICLMKFCTYENDCMAWCNNRKTFVLHVPLDGLLVESELPRHLVHEPDRGRLLQEERYQNFLHTGKLSRENCLCNEIFPWRIKFPSPHHHFPCFLHFHLRLLILLTPAARLLPP